MRLPLLQVVAMGVMYRMTALPAEVRNQQQAVQRKADPAFQPAVGMKRVMAAFMSDHPAAHGHSPRDNAIENPQGSRPELERNERSNAIGQKGQAQRHAKARPCLEWIETQELRRKNTQKFNLARVLLSGRRLGAAPWQCQRRMRRDQGVHRMMLRSRCRLWSIGYPS